MKSGILCFLSDQKSIQAVTSFQKFVGDAQAGNILHTTTHNSWWSAPCTWRFHFPIQEAEILLNEFVHPFKKALLLDDHDSHFHKLTMRCAKKSFLQSWNYQWSVSLRTPNWPGVHFSTFAFTFLGQKLILFLFHEQQVKLQFSSAVLTANIFFPSPITYVSRRNCLLS